MHAFSNLCVDLCTSRCVSLYTYLFIYRSMYLPICLYNSPLSCFLTLPLHPFPRPPPPSLSLSPSRIHSLTITTLSLSIPISLRPSLLPITILAQKKASILIIASPVFRLENRHHSQESSNL